MKAAAERGSLSSRNRSNKLYPHFTSALQRVQMVQLGMSHPEIVSDTRTHRNLRSFRADCGISINVAKAKPSQSNKEYAPLPNMK